MHHIIQIHVRRDSANLKLNFLKLPTKSHSLLIQAGRGENNNMMEVDDTQMAILTLRGFALFSLLAVLY